MNNCAIIEIRPGTGGEEAKIWANDLLRMYTRLANRRNWKVILIDEGVIKISGPGAFDLLKFEAGVHRVQRIPQTERRGRVHTSTATVAVLPEIPANQILIRPEECEWEFYRASSQGGQNVQKVSSAVRLRHKPSGLVVTAQAQRFQEQNRADALNILRGKLWEQEELRKEATIAGYRSVIGQGKRAEKIRTYNFPQNRITDHRINKSWGNLDAIIDGALDKIIESLRFCESA
ncbi:PCRF domain-containing protein [Candidatus Shapirobacteria bacterium]|nr:PCRF domain-containing protein [Candidatus Shapirobacteria bacterium]